MSFLDWFIKTVEGTAQDAQYHVNAYLPIWRAYLATIPKKEKIIPILKVDNELQAKLAELKTILDVELVEIDQETKLEQEIIKDVESIDHVERIKDIEKLDILLGHEKTKYEYVYNLLLQLHDALKIQIHITENLLKGSKEPEKLILHLGLQFQLEQSVIAKINEIKTFNNLFSELVRREQIIKVLDEKEKRLYKKMSYFLSKAVSQAEAKKNLHDAIHEGRELSGSELQNLELLEMSGTVMHGWVDLIFNEIRNRVDDHIEQGILKNHANVEFEYVNRPEFVERVSAAIQHIRKKPVSPQMLNAVVQLCREEFNKKLEL